MAINKNFVVKNGLEVNTNQIFADYTTSKVGIGSTLPTVVLDVQGGIAATDVVSHFLRITGIATLPFTQINNNLNVSGFTTAVRQVNVLGMSSISNLRVVGVSTFDSDVNLVGNVNVTGFSTFVGLTSVVGNLKVSGFSTFSNLSDFTGNVKISGVTTISTLGDTSGVVAVGAGKSLISINNVIVSPAGIAVTGITTISTLGNTSGVVAVGSGKSLISIDNVIVSPAGIAVTGITTISTLGNTSGVVAVGAGKSLISINNIIVSPAGIAVTGIVTATSFSGSFSGTGIVIGIQSQGTVVSTATSTINFVPVNASISVDQSDGGSGITTVTFQSSGISIGLAIALG